MKTKSILLLICALCVSPLFAQNKYYVNETKGSDTNDGLSWSNAFATLQPALEKAVAADEIWVAAGTYLPTKAYLPASISNISAVDDNRYRSFVLPKGVQLYGGFPATATDATGMAQRNWVANPTLLSGDFNNDDEDNFTNMIDNACHVLIIIEGDAQTVVDGFTISGGNANGNNETVSIDGTPVYGSYGGGIFASVINGSMETSPTLRNVIIENNNAIDDGGGFYNYAHRGEANPTIINAIIRNNKAGYSGKNTPGTGGYGGGIYNSGVTKASPLLTNVIISGNDAERLGGGFYCYSERNIAAPVLTNVLISGNSAHDAGGMYCYTIADKTAPVLINVSIVGNKAVDDGAGLACLSGTGTSAPEIRNSVLWGNKCTGNTTNQNPNLFNLADTGNPIIHHSFIEGEAASASAGNLNGTLDPQFVSAVHADFAPTSDGNYQLNKTSPLINKGKNEFNTLTIDLADKTRVIDQTIDIGAYEYPELGGGSNDDTSNNEIQIENGRVWANAGNLYVKVETATTIRIYTVDGALFQQINNVAEGTKAISLPAGIYFVSLNDDVKAKIFVPFQ